MAQRLLGAVVDRKYEFELWSIANRRVADISALMHNRQFTLERNEAETLTFDLDLDEFQLFCTLHLNADPKDVLFPYRTDIKIKRYGEYMFGVQVVAVQGTLDVDTKTITVQCAGYLNLLQDRYVTQSYAGLESVLIAQDLIRQTQAQTNGDMGITLQEFPYQTGIQRGRNYQRDNVKTSIQRLTSLIDGNFDFDFRYDKQFRVYKQIGILRTDLELIYPGNITSVTIERSGLNIFNKIIALGSGFGDDQLTSMQSDPTSQQLYYLREKITQYNSVVLQQTLDDHALADVQFYKEMLEIPQVVVTGLLFPEGVQFIGIGDRVPLSVADQPYFDTIDGLYRVEKLEVTLDDNDFESTINVYFDNMGVDQSETDENEAEQAQ